jgi:uncharacterized membrane protein
MSWTESERIINAHTTEVFLVAEFVLAVLLIAGLMVVGTKRWDAVGIALVSFFVVVGGIFATSQVGAYVFPLSWLRHLPTVHRIVFFVAVNALIVALVIDAWTHRVWARGRPEVGR